MKIEGHELKITPAPLQKSMDLMRSVANALRDQGLDLESVEINAADPAKTEVPLDAILRNVLSVATDPVVINLLFDCAHHALVNSQRIDREFFEPVERRKYFYPVMLEILKVNVMPFFDDLGSWFGGLQGMIKSTPKQK